jgi:hypothetical protein
VVFATVNSAWRSSAQQYLLYKWYLGGGCGIQIAAKPGTSNHEAGLAIDTSYYEYWRPALESHGWQWHGSSDLVHFDYVAGGSDDRSAGLLAFQRLWNRYNEHKVNTVASLFVQLPTGLLTTLYCCFVTDR